ncbi:MAG: hypothetical protein NXI13_13945 [Proteobacteria bacterium]|nr:hypothetical protein [Pseudomonadota bacterium]
MRILIIAIVCTFLSVATANAMEVNNLLDGCDTNEPIGSINPNARCFGYIVGALDAFQVSGDFDEPKGLLRCVPEEVTYGQAAVIVWGYVKEFPELWHYTAAAVVRSALINKFGCD